MSTTGNPSAMPPERDIEADLAAQVAAAQAEGRRLAIAGGGTKAFYGRSSQADSTLDVAPHQGVVAYEPTELAITVRAGTPLAAVEALLEANGQQLPFEPPHFGDGATVGGVVAAGLSGPRRPYAASVRDAVLGVRMVNGRGQALSFGGRVMKNVAGYDVARLMAGSLGVLGVLLEVSLKVMPRPVGELTLRREAPLDAALRLMREWTAKLPNLSATAWVDGSLYARVSGSDDVQGEARETIGGEPVEGAAFWADLREQRLPAFAGEAPLWRLSVAPASGPLGLADGQVVEWGGALRWIRGDLDTAAARAAAKAAGGHATLFRATAAVARDAVFAPLEPVPARLHREIKRAFDPAGILNPGRMYAEV